MTTNSSQVVWKCAGTFFIYTSYAVVYLWEAWKADALQKNPLFACARRLRRRAQAKRNILGDGFAAPEPPPPNACHLKETWQ
jgi:hypothetical protein